ncbi:MAG: hypothetical protein SOR93_14180 [Clostridiales Family XIII bacterium]|uniref:hypothetical protein n=1 Tax=Hominibacterium faecale TaxID=2839743 RepID=UPI0022B2A0D0|nr:hypothetical protein [Hominibacterium faecale]MCI7301001.1 hypothetical protein [Clostridia bacterium]MDY3012386.1 hypothetical protein [Clostridiales Family XIII bacterium]
MKAKVEIKLNGIDELEALIKENERLTFKLNRNIEEINNMRLHINAQIKNEQEVRQGENSDISIKYICDRRACLKCTRESIESCKHTSDIRHAKNFKVIDGVVFETAEDLYSRLHIGASGAIGDPKGKNIE